MMIDLKLLLPSYLLENSDRLRELIEVVEEVVGEVISDIQDIDKLFELWTIERERLDEVLIDGFISNFGLANRFLDFSNRSVYAFVTDWIKTRGTTAFIQKLGNQLGIITELQDLSKECLVWSKDSAWSVKVFQDGRYYREGSVLYRSLEPIDRGISEFLPVGVYWWFVLVFIYLILSLISLQFCYSFCIPSEKRVEGLLSFRCDSYYTFSERVNLDLRSVFLFDIPIRKEVRVSKESRFSLYFAFENRANCYTGMTVMPVSYVGKMLNFELFSKVSSYGIVLNQNAIILPQ